MGICASCSQAVFSFSMSPRDTPPILLYILLGSPRFPLHFSPLPVPDLLGSSLSPLSGGGRNIAHSLLEHSIASSSGTSGTAGHTSECPVAQPVHWSWALLIPHLLYCVKCSFFNFFFIRRLLSLGFLHPGQSWYRAGTNEYLQISNHCLFKKSVDSQEALNGR